ncbi:DUF6768 family protein [Chromatocurvus halotolerans]|uniref:Uncharacterized protein n=1 Tax=Chromatocurvus halotolerans TaxID=1132028 RepID=A0A4V2SBK5_9GAMM|nr:DUF6768 family protein [Chromatocurvus halotolerans]TCO75880.1 hypothetical protein EV688_10670 [Chromatocurvus halotolerans]
MSNVDDMIRKTLEEQDRAVWAELGEEPGYLRQAFGLFRGPLGWVMRLVMAVQLALFGTGIWAAINLMDASDPVRAVQWGVLVVVLVQIITFLRGFMGSQFEANRILRELALVQLKLSSGAAPH